MVLRTVHFKAIEVFQNPFGSKGHTLNHFDTLMHPPPPRWAPVLKRSLIHFHYLQTCFWELTRRTGKHLELKASFNLLLTKDKLLWKFLNIFSATAKCQHLKRTRILAVRLFPYLSKNSWYELTELSIVNNGKVLLQCYLHGFKHCFPSKFLQVFCTRNNLKFEGNVC